MRARHACSFGASGPQREKESISDAKLPDIYIRALRKIGATVARVQPHFVRQIVIQAKFGTSSVIRRKRVSCDYFGAHKLLNSKHRFKPTQRRAISPELREAVRGLDPVAVAAR